MAPRAKARSMSHDVSALPIPWRLARSSTPTPKIPTQDPARSSVTDCGGDSRPAHLPAGRAQRRSPRRPDVARPRDGSVRWGRRTPRRRSQQPPSTSVGAATPISIPAEALNGLKHSGTRPMQRFRKMNRPCSKRRSDGTRTPHGTPLPFARAAYHARTCSTSTSAGSVTSPLFHCACGSPEAIRRIPGSSAAPPPRDCLQLRRRLGLPGVSVCRPNALVERAHPGRLSSSARPRARASRECRP